MENIKYRILTFVRYLGDSFYYPFIALYLKSRGLVESKIGFIIGLSPLIGVLLNPLYTLICKNFKRTKNVLGIISILEAIAITFISFSTNFTSITICAIFIAIFGACHYGLMDSLVTIYAEVSNKPYSSIRVFGSIAYVIGTMGGGLLIKYISYSWCFIIANFLFIISGIIYLLINPIDKEKEELNIKPIEVFKNKSYYLYLIVFVLFMTICFSGDHFFSLFLKSKGFDESQFGFVYSYYVIIETIVMIILTKFKDKLKGDVLILAAIVFMLIRQFVNFLDLNIVSIIILSGLRGISVGIFFHVAYTYFLKLLGLRLTTIGIMIANCGQQLGIFLMDNVNGQVIDNYGFKTFYLILVILCVVLLLIQIIRMVLFKRKKVERIII